MTHREYEVLVRVDGGGGRCASRRLPSRSKHRRHSSPRPSTASSNGDGSSGSRSLMTDAEAALTAAGSRALGKASGPHAERVRQLLITPMEAEDLATVAASLGATADHLRAHRRGDHCDDETCPLN